MRDEQTLSRLLKLLCKTTTECEFDWNSDSEVSTYECPGSPCQNSQIFSDHIMVSKRFQKTLYHGEISYSNFHPPFALTDATLELFNKTVPNTGQLDVLTMDYAASVSRAVCISPYSMVLAMMYLEQLRHKNPDYLESVSPCELFVVSLLVASKYLFDNDEEFTYNCDWAEAANMEVQDLNMLEKDFLTAINWELFTSSADFFTFLSKVEHRIAVKRASQRGWLSYSDICVLSSHKIFIRMWLQVSSCILKVVLVVSVGYVAALFVVFGAISLSLTSQKPAQAVIHKLVAYDLSPFYLYFGVPANDTVFCSHGFQGCFHQDYGLYEDACVSVGLCMPCGKGSREEGSGCASWESKSAGGVMNQNCAYNAQLDFMPSVNYNSIIVSRKCNYSVLQT